MSQISPPQLPVSPVRPIERKNSWLYAFWKFSRPHTVIGTSFSVFGLYLISLANSDKEFIASSLLSLALAWIACLGGNIYIVGLNQLEDVAIDKINKPHLPLASGEFSLSQGRLIIGFCGILSLLLAWLQGPFLLGVVAISLVIGTAYSLPPIRLKQFPFLAALCIFSVRGAIVNLGLFLHFHWLWLDNLETRNFASLQTIPPEVWGLTLFILVFAVAIAIFKDIPDLEGDRLYNITTFTIKLGAKAVFNLSRWLLTACYLGIIIAGVWFLPKANPVFLAISHLVALGFMWWQSRQLDLQDKKAIARFYQFIWKLFFLEYLIFPAACLLI
ncbi:MAG: homogentisate phytyltransferase [Cyanosarcina radialis HA8281-LM2]|jgi:homogentisate phytyltransferase/homogentisate geranylgeranyltransferase|nr:homogentisate phytyltransferase [Cyanosarcina radialis HA8281-LM2]